MAMGIINVKCVCVCEREKRPFSLQIGQRTKCQSRKSTTKGGIHGKITNVNGIRYRVSKSCMERRNKK